MLGDPFELGPHIVSVGIRHFEERRGKGSPTFLARPLTAAAATVTGVVTDARTL